MIGATGTTTRRIMTPLLEDERVELPSGMSLTAQTVRLAVTGSDPSAEHTASGHPGRQAARGIRWNDNSPEAVDP